MTLSPEVSVVIPSRNRWELLPRALHSALSQRDVRVEAIVVDDGSAETGPPDLPGLADGRTRLLRHEQSRGQACARNSGIAAARGEWLGFLDDDDVWAPSKLRAQLDAAARLDAAGPAAAFVYCGVLLVDEQLWPLERAEAPDPDSLLPRLLRSNRIPAGASTVIARTDLVRSVGCWDERLTVLSDWDLWIRLAQAGPAAAVPEPAVAYVLHAGEMRRATWAAVRAEVGLVARKHSAALHRHDLTLDLATWRGYVAWLQSGSGARGDAAWGYTRAAELYLQQHSYRFAMHSLKDAAGALAGRKRPLWVRSTYDPPWLAAHR